jgi:hypothetical protein
LNLNGTTKIPGIVDGDRTEAILGRHHQIAARRGFGAVQL